MQLYAKDLNIGVVFVGHAERQRDYLCLECGSEVRVRGGMHRQSHFYHLEAHRTCSLHAKSMTHIQIQCHLQNLFSPAKCLLEHAFPEIRRIADVFWIPHRLIFEIQCSPITADEVKARNENYASIGYQVIWILHDRRFNQWRLSAAENFLKNFPHYYTNINSEGEGFIYDQYSLLERGIRKVHLSPLTVDLASPHFLESSEKLNVPQVSILLNRIHQWPVCFSGDLLARWMFDQKNFCNADYWFELIKIETAFVQKKGKLSFFSIIKALWKRMIHSYRFLFSSALEKICR